MPGILFTVLSDASQIDEVAELIFRSTGSFGVRRYPVERVELEREHVEGLDVGGCDA